MLFQQLVNMIFRNVFVASLLTICDIAVPTTLSARCFRNRIVASFLTSWDNAVPTTCQQVMFSTGL
jgi:hypothetical protein